MPLVYMRRYTRAIIRANPDWYFVFGDNLLRQGLGGQAREARGEPNTIGIVTKRAPHNGEDAFFTDKDFTVWQFTNKDLFALQASLIEDGNVIVWPLDGIGTGLAQLDKRAPRIHRQIGVIVGYLEMQAIKRES